MAGIIQGQVVQAGCGAAIWSARGELLLIQRLREPEAGHWGLPGGKIDFGEAAEVATRREIKEELGVEIKLNRLACFSEIIDRGDGAHWVSPIFEAEIMSGTVTNLEPEKHGGCEWYAPDALPKDLTTPTRQYLADRAKSES